MSYQLCRWYDPYPRLAFALQLLYLAPQALREKAMQELALFLGEHLGEGAGEKVLQRGDHLQGDRWYDRSPNTATAVEMLRQSPESLKTRGAEALLGVLARN